MYMDTHCHITRDDYDDIPFLISSSNEGAVNASSAVVSIEYNDGQ